MNKIFTKPIIITILICAVAYAGVIIQSCRESFKKAEDSTSTINPTAVTENPTPAFYFSNLNLYDSLLKAAADEFKIPLEDLKSIVFLESGGNNLTKRPDGELGSICGLMGIRANSGNAYYLKNLSPEKLENIRLQLGEQFDPQKDTTTCERLQKSPLLNVTIGASILAWNYTRNIVEFAKCEEGTTVKTPINEEEKSILTAASYNAGPTANCLSKFPECSGKTYWECDKNQSYQETREYVSNFKKIKKDILDKKQITLSPPKNFAP